MADQQQDFPQTDRDLLIRIDERVRQLVTTIGLDRIAADARALRHEVELEKLRTVDLEKIRTDVEGLRTSRAQFYAIAATLSTVIGILIRVFWK
jgi:hypothetical protein